MVAGVAVQLPGTPTFVEDDLVTQSVNISDRGNSDGRDGNSSFDRVVEQVSLRSASSMMAAGTTEHGPPSMDGKVTSEAIKADSQGAKRRPGDKRKLEGRSEVFLPALPRLKDTPGLYRIVASDGVTALRTLPGSCTMLRQSTADACLAVLGFDKGGDRMLPAWSLLLPDCSRFCRSRGAKRKRPFVAKRFEQGDLVRILQVDESSIPGWIYGKVEEANGWIPLLQLCDKQAFADKVSLKEQVMMTLDKPVYDVQAFYKTEGVWQALAKNPRFEHLTLLVITINAFWMWYDADENSAAALLEAAPVFQIAEHFFCVFFSFEWSVRFMAFEKKQNGLKDSWFIFDTTLVSMMVVETWVMTIILLTYGSGMGGTGGNSSLLRLLRLLRLSRLARMLRTMPELMIMIKGIVAAFRTVALAIFLLIILMYIFAIMFRQLTHGSEIGDAYFSNMGHAMYTLLLNGTFLEDLYSVINELGAKSFVYAGIFFVFILLSALTVMNMLIGILCEVVSSVAKVEKEQMLMEFVSAKMEDIMKELDDDVDGKISKSEFRTILHKQEAVCILAETGVDVRTLVDYTDFIFESEDGEDRELSLKQFMDVVLSFRSCNTATVKDAVDIRKWISKSFKRLDDLVKNATSGVPKPTGHSSPGRRQEANDQADTWAGLYRLDAFFAALAGELALLAADLAAAPAVATASSVVAPVPGVLPPGGCDTADWSSAFLRPGTPLDEPPLMGGGLETHSVLQVPAGRLHGHAKAQAAHTFVEEVSGRLERLEHYGGLAWDELQRLDGCMGASGPTTSASARSVRLWRATAEEFLLAAWTDGLARLHAPDADGKAWEGLELQGCVARLLSVVRQRHSSLRSILSGSGGIGTPSVTSASPRLGQGQLSSPLPAATWSEV